MELPFEETHEMQIYLQGLILNEMLSNGVSEICIDNYKAIYDAYVLLLNNFRKLEEAFIQLNMDHKK